MNEQEQNKDVDIKQVAENLNMSETITFSEVIGDRNIVPPFSSLSVEAIEDLEVTDFKSTEAIDQAVINTNQTAQQIKIDMMSQTGQKPSELGNDIKFRDQKLFDTTSQGFPTELDTEELPQDIGGATPRASGGVSRSRGGTDLRTTGNPYGYA